MLPDHQKRALKDLFVEAIKKNLQHVNVLPDELKDELRKVTAIYAECDLHMNVTVPGSSLYFLLGCFQDIIMLVKF